MLEKTQKSYSAKSRTSWRALQYFNIYRILLTVLFVVLVDIGQLPQPLGVLDAKLFSIVSHTYLAISLVFAAFIYNRLPRLNLQISIHTLVDIVMLGLMMYSSNGLSSGFGMLLVIAVAGGSILRAGKISILYAAIASLAVLGHEIYVQFFLFYHDVNYIHAGILGATFFVTAIIGNFLSARVKQTEALAEQQAKELTELAELNEHIVQRMQSGILVFDDSLNILLINESAKQLMLRQNEDSAVLTNSIIQNFKPYIENWVSGNGKQNVIIKLADSDIEVRASCIKLTYGESYQLLVFLEETASLKQKAQQLKLASLGRLAASIAHEVRNPLGAINHAGQLLKESPSLNQEDKRLTEIINDHSLRVNTIIDNVLSISRREQTTSEQFNLIDWLNDFIQEFRLRYDLDESSIEMKNAQQDVQVKFDPTQLHQVIWNLCENASRYSHGSRIVTLNVEVSSEIERPHLDIIDYGKGMTDDTRDQIFEPFFTTESSGSGLGLYLARELCEANQASLGLISSSEKGTIFRISFMHIDKQADIY